MNNIEFDFDFLPNIKTEGKEIMGVVINSSDDPDGVVCIKDININDYSKDAELIGFYFSKNGNRIDFYEKIQPYSLTDKKYFNYFDEDEVKNFAWECLLKRHDLSLPEVNNNGWKQIYDDIGLRLIDEYNLEPLENNLLN